MESWDLGCKGPTHLGPCRGNWGLQAKPELDAGVRRRLWTGDAGSSTFTSKVRGGRDRQTVTGPEPAPELKPGLEDKP